MSWRVARCLDQLLSQWDAAHPNRSTASDGDIGDAAHAARTSDHNPWVGPASDGKMIVTARDFTHDPAHGADADQLAAALVASRDPRIKYLIRNRRMCRSYPKTIDGVTHPAWTWLPYPGDNPHTKHLHLSCQSDSARYDDVRSWKITNEPEDEMSARDVEDLKEFIRTEVYAGPRYAALQNSLNVANRAIAAIIPHLKAEDIADDAALTKAVADLKADIAKADATPEPAP